MRYLRNISDHSSILRATVMKWCNENEIDVIDIFLIDQMAAMQQHHSNESYVAICKQDSVIKNKLNHVSANKTVNIKKQFTLAESFFQQFRTSSLKEIKTCIKEGTKLWITKYTSKEAITKSDFRYGRTYDTLERCKKRTNIDFSMTMFSNNKL